MLQPDADRQHAPDGHVTLPQSTPSPWYVPPCEAQLAASVAEHEAGPRQQAPVGTETTDSTVLLPSTDEFSEYCDDAAAPHCTPMVAPTPWLFQALVPWQRY